MERRMHVIKPKILKGKSVSAWKEFGNALQKKTTVQVAHVMMTRNGKLGFRPTIQDVERLRGTFAVHHTI
ncbi:hypothetical protein Bhyg_12208 [Pseudolycoriella hygida]|uniref:Uncharacterized protein n=1 Tax=Pseudolycoriella hygida TaxID=35572 RepID=A0A9Q0S0Z1_9DIPT|nr:hypothetical protein Bhyg_12208 [Pseudolycoriella hygida]